MTTRGLPSAASLMLPAFLGLLQLEGKNQERDPEAAAAAALGVSGAAGACPFVGGVVWAGGAGEAGWAGLA